MTKRWNPVDGASTIRWMRTENMKWVSFTRHGTFLKTQYPDERKENYMTNIEHTQKA